MSDQVFKLSVEKVESVTVVHVAGPVDSAHVELFKAELTPLCAVPGARVLLDCGQLTYLNSSSIGLLRPRRSYSPSTPRSSYFFTQV